MSIFIWIENSRYGFSIMKQGHVVHTCPPRYLSRQIAEERAKECIKELT